MDKKKIKLPLIVFMVFSFIILPAVAFPLLIHIGQVDRFAFLIGGYLGIATQVVSLCLKEARIWRLRLFDYEEKKTGKWISIIILTISAVIFCYGIYYIFFSWQVSST